MNLGNVTGYATMDTIAADTQNGQAAGTLQAFAIGQDGSLSGVFSNGVKEVLAQIAVATFNNPDGLTKNGDSTYGGDDQLRPGPDRYGRHRLARR